MKYMIGCNYWGSKHGTDMWRKWDAESVRNDLKKLSLCVALSDILKTEKKL